MNTLAAHISTYCPSYGIFTVDEHGEDPLPGCGKPIETIDRYPRSLLSLAVARCFPLLDDHRI